MSIGKIPRFFFNWKRIIFWIIFELGRIAFLILKPHLPLLTSFLSTLLRFPSLQAYQPHYQRRHRHCGAFAYTVPSQNVGLGTVLHLTFCSVVTFSEKPSQTTLSKRIQLFYSLFTLIYSSQSLALHDLVLRIYLFALLCFSPIGM